MPQINQQQNPTPNSMLFGSLRASHYGANLLKRYVSELPRKKAQHLIETFFRYGEIRFEAIDTVAKPSQSLSIEEWRVLGMVARPRDAFEPGQMAYI